jgi:putative transposase
MAHLNQRKSLRLPNWDYRWNAHYFVTICTKNRVKYFGEIINGEMHLSDAGKIANDLWYEIPNHSKNIVLGEFIVMPDHIHGIITIDNPISPFSFSYSGHEHAHALYLMQISMGVTNPKHLLKLTAENRFQNIGPNSLSSIVGSYKSAVSKHVRRTGIKFEWQKFFYERIVRSKLAYFVISKYIKNNPIKWESKKRKTAKSSLNS